MQARLRVNQIVESAGDVTQLRSIIHQPPRVLEKRIGFEAGRLAKGWLVLQLIDKVGSGEFAYGGSTAASGGFDPDNLVENDGVKYRVHVSDVQRNAFLADTGSNTQADEKFSHFMVNQLTLLNDRQSDCRIVKVRPKMDHDKSKPAYVQYPDAPRHGGIKQWTLFCRKRFLVVADIPPGYIYGGGGAQNIYR
jgi:hypothetical protein